MKLYTVEVGERSIVARERDGALEVLPYRTMLEAILDGEILKREGASPTEERLEFRDVHILAPLKPGKLLCSGVNYHGHFAENPNAKMPSEPFFFAKLPNAVCGPGDPISKGHTMQLDYEVEFAVVIGARLPRNSPPEAVMPAIFGYTVLNDISARDVQFKENQITLGKNFDGFAPLGPCILTKDALPHPERARLRTHLNGTLMQDGGNDDWVFTLSDLLSSLSNVMTLEPGDVVSTGTPRGVGIFQTPPVFMEIGDTVVVEVEGIGRLENLIVA